MDRHSKRRRGKGKSQTEKSSSQTVEALGAGGDSSRVEGSTRREDEGNQRSQGQASGQVCSQEDKQELPPLGVPSGTPMPFRRQSPSQRTPQIETEQVPLTCCPPRQSPTFVQPVGDRGSPQIEEEWKEVKSVRTTRESEGYSRRNKGRPDAEKRDASHNPTQGLPSDGQKQIQQQSMGDPPEELSQSQGQLTSPVKISSASPVQPMTGQGYLQSEGQHTPPRVPIQSSESQQRLPQKQYMRNKQEKFISKAALYRPSTSTTIKALVPRPARCANRLGRQIKIDTNFFRLDLTRITSVFYHYDIETVPDRPKYLIRPAVNNFLQKIFPHTKTSFDGRKNVISCKPLVERGDVFEDEIEIPDDENNNKIKKIKIKIQWANEIDMTVLRQVHTVLNLGLAQTAIQALDIVLRGGMYSKFIHSGRSFFSPPPGDLYELGEGMELWHGFYQSAILGARPYLNIDVSHKGFPSGGPVIDILRNFLGVTDFNKTLQRVDLLKLKKFIKSLKVDYEIPDLRDSRRTWRVNDITGVCAASEKFRLDNGQEITILDYYANEKKYKIKYPNLNLIHVGPRDRKIFVPLELCSVRKGQVVPGKLTPNQTDKMVRASAVGTGDRRDKIYRATRNADYNGDDIIREFNISVANEFEKVDARVIDPPNLNYEGNEKTFVRQGQWRPNRFLKPANCKSWCIVNFDQRTRYDAIMRFQELLIKCGRRLGMVINNPVQQALDLQPKRIREFFQDNKHLDLIVCILPERSDMYAQVKQIAEIEVGVLTQCVMAKTVSKINDSTSGNLILKINAKLNGQNHALHMTSRPPCLKHVVMFVGADVTHPSPDATNIPSLVGVAASYDLKAFQYNMITRIQSPRVEIIEDLENIIKEQLIFFYRNTGLKPEKIIFFRDGVSDAQLMQVRHSELQAIHRACASLEAGGTYKPRVTMVIVQKRHHTRFFPPPGSNYVEDRKNFNVPAGTVVDTDIVLRNDFDFYLVSHASIQGTARPTKYRVIWDDNNMSEDELEQLTYYLCHLFSRCTRSVSYPAPTYYAHLAAFRARVHLEGREVNLVRLDNEQRRIAVKTELGKGKPMFFV